MSARFLCFQLDKVMQMQPHVIGGERVHLGIFAKELDLRVYDILSNTSEERLRQYFEQFGPAMFIIPHEWTANLSRNIGYVKCSSQQMACLIQLSKL